jgi:hypothetical protein
VISRNPRTKAWRQCARGTIPINQRGFPFQEQNVPRLGKLLHCGRVSGCNADRLAVRRHLARRWVVYAAGTRCHVLQIHVILKQRKVDFASPDWLDWTLFSLVPMLGYASLIVGAAGLIAEQSFAPYAIAGAITLLLLAGIYGAWSVTLWIARNRDKI